MKLKKRSAYFMFAIVMSSFVLIAKSSESESTYSCKVSSKPADNNGFCRELKSGNGDMCFTYGPGTRCSGDIVEETNG